jgi:DNA polymerase-1
MAQPQFILIDGSSYLYRAFHALPPLVTSKGKPTGAIKGVLNMVTSLIKEYQPEHIAVVFDAKGPTFRNELYSEYKANRPPMPDELREQIEPLHELIKALGLPLLSITGVEADDVIGTLAKHAAEKGIETLISTGDKDMAQLVTDKVKLINTMSNTYFDEAGVVEKFGVRPNQIIDYLALVGDTSDNIPGVPKCGPKTAVKWLAEYESLKGVMESAEEVKGKVGENLRNSLDFLPLSYELATIKLDVDLPHNYESLLKGDSNQEKLKTLYEQLEFKTQLRALEKGEDSFAPSSNKKTKKESEPNEKPKVFAKAPDTHYETILEEKQFDEWLERLSKAKLVAFDTETTGLEYMSVDLVGVSFSCKPGEAAYLPFTHDYMGAPQQLDRSNCLEKLKPILESKDIAKVGQHIKFDMNVLSRFGVSLVNVCYDTMLESYVLNSVAGRHDMDSLAERFLGIETVHFEDIAGKGAKQLTFNQIDLEKAGHYAAEDADITLRLHEAIWSELSEEESLSKVFKEIEVPLIPVLAKTEQAGVLIDKNKLAKQSKKLEGLLQELEKQVYELAGEEFNLNSPKQLGHILFEKLEIPAPKKTKTGQYSTAEPVLHDLAYEHELPRLILEYRSYAKLKSTYTDVLPTLINENTGRVHTSYHQAVAATGRLSSSDPNLQNIPIRNEEGRKIRQAFIAPKGYKILAADYSQIELRIMAHLSQDKGLISAFKAGEDIHKATAAEVNGITLMEVSAEDRRRAKAVNFGLIYGMSAFGLAKQLEISRKEAQDYINTYFSRYTGVQEYMDNIRSEAREQGYVETLFGRRLYLPSINDRNGMRRQAAERTAINAPMQGSAADIIKLAMIRVDRWLEESQLDAKVIMQVHDELVLEVNEKQVKEVSEGLKQEMGKATKLDIPLVVDVGVGDNWDEAH